MCDIICGMNIEMPIKANVVRRSLPSHPVSQDVELVMNAMRGIADMEAGRCDSVAEVRARVLSRYQAARVCV